MGNAYLSGADTNDNIGLGGTIREASGKSEKVEDQRQ